MKIVGHVIQPTQRAASEYVVYFIIIRELVYETAAVVWHGFQSSLNKDYSSIGI
jgi:hypothetical protein